MGLLDGDIADLFGTAFGSFYLAGTISTVTYTDDGSGSLTRVTASAVACKVQRDACTERQKLEDGYTAKDVRLIVLQSGAGATPQPGDRLTVAGTTYTLGPTITQDPAASYWECRGVPI